MSSLSSSSNPTSSSPKITIRVCEGSSCLSKCRGVFSPKSSFGKRISSLSPSSSSASVVLEEAYCMNQCKRGPNVRVIRDDQVITFNDGGIMSDTEINRKTFQSVGNEGRVDMIWGLTQGMVSDGADNDNDSNLGTESGSVDKLTDMM